MFNDFRRREDPIVTTDSRTPTADQGSHDRADHACSCLSRRRALTGFAAVGVGVPFLAACGSDDSSAADPGSSSDAGSPSGGSTPSAPESSAGGGGAAAGLTTAADVPVGGGTIFADEGVVITQPAEGEFKGFSNICTHQGCPVTSVEDGAIVCSCHNSMFSIEDGSVQGGPASSPLEEVALTVSGDSISLA